MKNIRESVFETNSSSTHSVTISCKRNKEYMYDTLTPESDGSLTFKGGDYSCAEFCESSALSKAN